MGRERVAAFVLEAAGRWREERRQQIEDGLARVDARLAGDLKAELDVLRGSAAELRELDLAVPEPGGRLTEDRRFFFSTGEEAGLTELLAKAIRRSAASPVSFASTTARSRAISSRCPRPARHIRLIGHKPMLAEPQLEVQTPRSGVSRPHADLRP
jgi:hypothetical protein